MKLVFLDSDMDQKKEITGLSPETAQDLFDTISQGSVWRGHYPSRRAAMAYDDSVMYLDIEEGEAWPTKEEE